MKTSKRFLITSAVALGCVSAFSAYGQSAAGGGGWSGGRLDTSLYLGGSVGYSRLNIDQSDVALPAGFTFTSFNKDEKDVGYKLFAGYRLHRNLAIEAGYIRLGEFSFNGTTAPPVSLSSAIKSNGWNIDAVGILPLQNNLSVLGKVGVFFSETKGTVTAVGPLGTASEGSKEREANLKLGLGVQYEVSDLVGVRAEWDHFRKVGNENTTGEGNFNLFSIGLIVRLR
jgi:OOP family OmpA-OmpF porin